MKAAVLILAATFSLVSAQYYTALPSCAISCVTSAISAAGCALNDTSCVCGVARPAIGTAASPCLHGACDVPNLISVASLATSFCSAAHASAASAYSTNASVSAAPTRTNYTAPASRPASVNATSITTLASPLPSSSSPSPSSGTSFSSSLATSTVTNSSSSVQPIATHKGLSQGAKSGIGVGATFGAIILVSFILFAFWYGSRSKRKSWPSESGNPLGRAELDGEPSQPGNTGALLSVEERAELESRRRAAHLGGAVPINITDIEGGERAELEARRKAASDPFSVAPGD